MTDGFADGDRIKRFISAFAVIITLRQRAWARACFVEYILLSWAQVDAMLRWGLVLKRQLESGDERVEARLIEGRLREREVIDTALGEGVIAPDVAENLHRLYQDRNKIVHRFFITDIDYEAAKRVASQMEPQIHHLTEVLGELEEEQVRTGRGMTRAGIPPDLEDEAAAYMDRYVAEKLGDDPESLDRVRPHMWPDVEDIIDFARRKGVVGSAEPDAET